MNPDGLAFIKNPDFLTTLMWMNTMRAPSWGWALSTIGIKVIDLEEIYEEATDVLIFEFI
jgi:hypothetical protein